MSHPLEWHYPERCMCDWCGDCLSAGEWLLKVGEHVRLAIKAEKAAGSRLVTIGFPHEVGKKKDDVVVLALRLATAPPLLRFRAVAEGWTWDETANHMGFPTR